MVTFAMLAAAISAAGTLHWPSAATTSSSSSTADHAGGDRLHRGARTAELPRHLGVGGGQPGDDAGGGHRPGDHPGRSGPCARSSNLFAAVRVQPRQEPGAADPDRRRRRLLRDDRFENAANVAESSSSPSKVYLKALLGCIVSAGLLHPPWSRSSPRWWCPPRPWPATSSALLEVVKAGAARHSSPAVRRHCAGRRHQHRAGHPGPGPGSCTASPRSRDVRVLARCHPTRKTPWVAILTCPSWWC